MTLTNTEPFPANPEPYDFRVCFTDNRLEWYDQNGDYQFHQLPDLRRMEDWRAIVNSIGLPNHHAARAWLLVYAAHMDAVNENGVALLPECVEAM
nr:hypothetical protein [uncultured Ruegeria sp.]